MKHHYCPKDGKCVWNNKNKAGVDFCSRLVCPYPKGKNPKQMTYGCLGCGAVTCRVVYKDIPVNIPCPKCGGNMFMVGYWNQK